MKADLHVHTVYSGYSSLPLLQKVLRESSNQPDRVYELDAHTLGIGPEL